MDLKPHVNREKNTSHVWEEQEDKGETWQGKKERGSEQEPVTDTFSRSGTQKPVPTRPPVEHEATSGV